MTYTMCCDDGFMVTSKDKEEVINLAAIHVMTYHPQMKITLDQIEDQVEEL